MSFENPSFLILLPLVWGLLIWGSRKAKISGFRFSSGELLREIPDSFRVKLSKHIILMRILTSTLILFALARPQWITEETKVQTEGVDMIFAVDVSTSMLAEDFQMGTKRVNRLEAVKKVVKEFVRGRKNDRIGMVAFAARAYPVSPLTRDHDWLLENLERVNVGMIEDNTALGSGLSSALIRLRDTPSKEKAVILLTDGRNNAGTISPATAATVARALKIRIYTIGAGSKGPAPYPVKDPFGNTMYKPIPLDIDETTLRSIALKTDAKYFRATDMTSLEEIFHEIDQLETTPIEEKKYYQREELFHLFLIPGLILLFLEIILNNTLLRKIP